MIIENLESKTDYDHLTVVWIWEQEEKQCKTSNNDEIRDQTEATHAGKDGAIESDSNMEINWLLNWKHWSSGAWKRWNDMSYLWRKGEQKPQSLSKEIWSKKTENRVNPDRNRYSFEKGRSQQPKEEMTSTLSDLMSKTEMTDLARKLLIWNNWRMRTMATMPWGYKCDYSVETDLE